MRGPITAVGSLVGFIREEFLFSSGAAGLLTTIPPVVFASSSPLISPLSERIGIHRTMLLGLTLIVLGETVRPLTGAAGLFAGTAVLSAGIAVANILLPAIIKLRFPQRIGLMTSLYTSVFSLLAGVAAGISVPLAELPGSSWRLSLLVWVILGAAALVFWVLQLFDASLSAGNSEKGERIPVHKSALAWHVAFFMGLQSLLFYTLVAWLPSIVQSYGHTRSEAGYCALLLQLASILSAFAAPILAGQTKDQRRITLIVCLVYLLGLFLLLARPAGALLLVSVALCGLGVGATIALALSFIGLRTKNAPEAASLSGMSQAVGYSVAALGPVALGGINDLFGSWTPAVLILILVMLLLTYMGQKAGADRYLFDREERA